MYYALALVSPPYSTLSYAAPSLLPEGLSPGLRAAVPLGRSIRTAVVLERHVALPESLKEADMKAVLWPLETHPLFDIQYIEMVCNLAARHSVTPGYILGHSLPAGLRGTRVRLRRFENGTARLFSLRQITVLPEAEGQAFAQAWARGEVETLPAYEDAGLGEFCSLLVDPPWPLRPAAVRQSALLDYLSEHGSVSRRALLKALGSGNAPALASLARQGCVCIGPREEANDEAGESLLPPPPAAFTLSGEQKAALADLRLDLEADCARSHLLFGVTGSGKTAVYLELARSCLERGRSVLLLAPEAALAQKLLRDAQLALSDTRSILYHGYLSAARRETIFRELAAGKEPCVVVGTRSSLFLPLPGLGLVVLDEEHDGSFKQDEGFFYHAKELAWFRAAQNKALLVLGSATPDLKTFYAAEQGELPMSRLSRRVGGGELPEIELINISGLAASDSLLAPQSLAALREVTERGEQAVVLLNRRGYAPHMYCLDCGEVPRCPHCAISLAWHKGRERLLCHYCGHSMLFPSPCAKCKSLHYLPMGEGTERLAETLAARLSPARLLRLDRDSTRRPGRVEEILEAFARREAQVLVGTQMLSKGHHFPDVTLALAADGDLGLNLPDYRAAERVFQLLVQSAGRSGLVRPGRVLIQTRDSTHYCWDFIRRGDYEGFYAAEIARRRQRRYPPFVRLALVRISFESGREEALPELARLTQALRRVGREREVETLGPAPAPLAVLRGRKRFHCLLKARDWPSVRAVFAEAVGAAEIRLLRTALDLDPVNML